MSDVDEVQQLKARLEKLENEKKVQEEMKKENEIKELKDKLEKVENKQTTKTTCPICHTDAPIVTKEKISTGGWIIFAILLLFLWWTLIGILLAIIPLLTMKEKYFVCGNCQNKRTPTS